MQKGPWDMQIHQEPFRVGTRLDAVNPVGAVRLVGPQRLGQEQVLHSHIPTTHKEKKRITKTAPHPYDDLFDETHIDLLA